MKKIPTIFVRDLETPGHLVRPVLAPGCDLRWALDAHATRKRDGTAILVAENHRVWKRYDAKHGKAAPPEFQPAQDPDPQTGHWPGWVPITLGPADRYLLEAIEASVTHGDETWPSVWPSGPGTYEFCGPKVNSNRERLAAPRFFRHGSEPLPFVCSAPDAPMLYARLAEFFAGPDGQVEGIVWWFGGQPLGKIKRKDFGYPWPLPESAP